MSTYIELEIQNLLKEDHDLYDVADRLIQYLDAHPDNQTRDNISALSRFLLRANLNTVLISYVLSHIDNENYMIPWPYFLEAIGNIGAPVDEATAQALIEGIVEQDAEEEASLAQSLNKQLPELSDWRSRRKYKIHQDYLDNKNLLLEQLITLRTQQVYAQEKNLLLRLQKLYPGDPEILREAQEYKHRHALEVLQKHSPKGKKFNEEDYSPREPEVETALKALTLSLQEHAEQNPAMAFDFAIVAVMLENYEAALVLLDYCAESEALAWLRLEVLLHNKRHIELLTEVSRVEFMLAHDPETFFATAYYRAQALWGIGQKHAALEVLEVLLANRPHYRAAGALYSIWSAQ